MNEELILKKCLKCGKVVRIMKGRENVVCCGEEMVTLVPNTEEASFEKHIPTYEISGEKITVKVNHVMEQEHYIEWILMITPEKECMKKFKPGDIAECQFKYVPGSKIYSYCNKHNLWCVEVK